MDEFRQAAIFDCAVIEMELMHLADDDSGSLPARLSNANEVKKQTLQGKMDMLVCGKMAIVAMQGYLRQRPNGLYASQAQNYISEIQGFLASRR